MSSSPNSHAKAPARQEANDVSTDQPAVVPIELNEEERTLILSDLDALLPTLDGARADRFRALRASAVAGTVPADLVAALESVLELTLQTGRARTRYRADGEGILTAVYRRTSAGRTLSKHLGQVNEALKTLAGDEVTSISVRMRTVGHFTIAIQTDNTTLTLAARPDTINVESIAVGA